ncbi:hypothetical protein H0G86_009934 [Trichoderma simmonsii]|uniref:Uncharacterized protein n=1 Tax=Trichoderma simmonsii TaxID=1491479 RepID=A0A8G0LII3_9HYPO|nr:hypothetical protein H0G86_009934 [Trichoderma simmonsii]
MQERRSTFLYRDTQPMNKGKKAAARTKKADEVYQRNSGQGGSPVMANNGRLKHLPLNKQTLSFLKKNRKQEKEERIKGDDGLSIKTGIRPVIERASSQVSQRNPHQGKDLQQDGGQSSLQRIDWRQPGFIALRKKEKEFPGMGL